MSIQVNINRDGENNLRELGWTIPQYPKTGTVLFDGKPVGWRDNFSGLIVKDSTAIDWLKSKDLPNMAMMAIKSVEYKYGSANVLHYPDRARPYQITVSPLRDLDLPSRTVSFKTLEAVINRLNADWEHKYKDACDYLAAAGILFIDRYEK